ncbi:MAG TPA: hypothetical protein VL091_09035 [Marinobacter sp.]|nr:hypothetical protein [Marinobacter sp.]
MPAYVKRIMLIFGMVISLSFVYEYNFSSKAVNFTGEIISIKGKAKGKDIVVLLRGNNQQKEILTFSIGPVIYLFEHYNVGDEIPIKYCSECYTLAKIGDTPNLYSLTLMISILMGIVSFAFIVNGLKGKRAQSGA